MSTNVIRNYWEVICYMKLEKAMVTALVALTALCLVYPGTALALKVGLPVGTPASTIYVPDDYALIQDAVDAASPGDTIIVSEGMYEENIKVNISLTVRSEKGPDSTIVRAEYPYLPVFEVAADYVNISGFTVKGTYENHGIYLYNVNYCTISSNICSDNEDGIFPVNANNNNIYLNNFINNNVNAASQDSSNTWSSSSKLTYMYNGKSYTNYLGN